MSCFQGKQSWSYIPDVPAGQSTSLVPLLPSLQQWILMIVIVKDHQYVVHIESVQSAQKIKLNSLQALFADCRRVDVTNQVFCQSRCPGICNVPLSLLVSQCYSTLWFASCRCVVSAQIHNFLEMLDCVFDGFLKEGTPNHSLPFNSLSFTGLCYPRLKATGLTGLQGLFAKMLHYPINHSACKEPCSAFRIASFTRKQTSWANSFPARCRSDLGEFSSFMFPTQYSDKLI